MIRLFEVERFDIKQKGEDRRDPKGVDDMDAVTSFELEAQRRRETLASDRRDASWARAEAVEAVGTEVAGRSTRVVLSGRRGERTAASAECQPAPAAR